jgi:hypothetical protein
VTAEFDDDAQRYASSPHAAPIREESFSPSPAASDSWVKEAEAARCAGRPEQARRLAEAGLVDEPYETAGRVVLALACLDLGDADAARRALEGAVAAWSPAAPEALTLDTPADEPFQVLSDPLADLAENELERAFDHAESEPVEAWTTNRVAEAALQSVEGGAPEDVRTEEPVSPFATETVASLYERQGDPERAHAIRRSLRGEAAAHAPGSDERKRWVSTLERWLDNLRRASR